MYAVTDPVAPTAGRHAGRGWARAQAVDSLVAYSAVVRVKDLHANSDNLRVAQSQRVGQHTAVPSKPHRAISAFLLRRTAHRTPQMMGSVSKLFSSTKSPSRCKS